MLNVELPNGTPNMVLKGASLTQHSTLNTQHSTFKKKKRWETIKVN